ncbi:MAG: hypothetical protein JSS27_09565 [Planctomycetes bacterium]|nr:hypothetical protein [Planctomycetota bacterium]
MNRLWYARWMLLAGLLSLGAGIFAWWVQYEIEAQIESSFYGKQLTISDDGKLFAIGTGVSWLTIRGAQDGEVLARRKEETVPVSLGFSDTGQQLLYGGHGLVPSTALVRNGHIKVYESKNLNQQRRIRVLGGIVNECAWGADSSMIGIVRFAVGKWDMKTGNRVVSYELPSLTGGRLRVTDGGVWFVYGVTGHGGKQIIVYDPKNKRTLLDQTQPDLAVHHTHLSADGRWLAVAAETAGRRGKLQVWDVPAGRRVADIKLEQSQRQVQFGAGDLLFSAGGEGQLNRWEFRPDAGLKLVKQFSTGEPSLDLVSWTPDGRRAAVASEWSLSIFDGESGDRLVRPIERMPTHAQRRYAMLARYALFVVSLGSILGWYYIRPLRPLRRR